MINVQIVEDHKVLAEGLERIISEVSYVHVMNKSGTLDECRTALRYERPDVLMLDVSLPDGDGIEFCEEIRKQYPDLKVLFLTSHCEYAVIARARSSGALGYVLKSSSPEEVLQAIRTVADGERYICHEAAVILRHQAVNEVRLSHQEREMLKLIQKGCSSVEIADTMHLGVETVRSYRKNLLHKLNVHNVAELVRKVVEEKLV